MQSKLLVVAAAATGALAIRDLSGSFPQNLRRGADILGARDEAGCFAAVAEHATVTADFPTVPTALVTADIPQITDPCQFPSVTGSAGQVLTSYSSALQSWQDAHITEIRLLWAACSDVPEISSLIAEYGTSICSTALAPITSGIPASGTASATATATDTASGEATAATDEATATGAAASSTAVPAAAAPRETGMLFAAAAAAAGFVGAVML